MPHWLAYCCLDTNIMTDIILFLRSNRLNTCPTQCQVQVWNMMKPLYWRTLNSKDAGRQPLGSSQGLMKWNKTKLMGWVYKNYGMHFCIGENGINPYPKLILSITKPIGGSMRACHAAGPGSIPGRDKFPGWGFSGFFLACKTNVWKL